jgi:hypothetical protein
VKVYALRSVPVRSLLKWAGLPPSSFYYKRSGVRKGIKPSTHSLTVGGERMENKTVVVQIELALRQEFCCYGYKNMTQGAGVDHQPQKGVPADERSPTAVRRQDQTASV